MSWRSQFNAAFFSEWTAQGLPPGSAGADAYRSLRSEIALPAELADAVNDAHAATHREVLERVYGFGHIVGAALAELLAGKHPDQPEIAAFCARFNLGISLFDWVCDEEGRARALATQPPFASLAGLEKPSEPHPPASHAEALLRVLADGLLLEIAERTSEAGENPLWQALKDMMHAQLALAENGIGPEPDLQTLYVALRRKSSGPFAFMGEWAALCLHQNRETGQAMGHAIGDIFWLVDDAKDIWEDFDAGRWNLFILAAFNTEPRLMESMDRQNLEFGLSRIFSRPGWAEGVIRPYLVEASRHFVRPSTPCDPVSLLSATVEKWLN